MRIIINADDCGKYAENDAVIEEFIKTGRITSTTIMANMYDFDNAVRLYKDYNEIISFGVHLNANEGSPLLYSQALLDYGFYKEEKGNVVFNGANYMHKLIPSYCRKALYKEFLEQITKLRDSGVVISHIDSHQHFHCTPSMLTMLSKLSKETGIYKIRSINNYGWPLYSSIARKGWRIIQCIQNPSVKFVDYFTDINFYYQLRNGVKVPDKTYEIMTHPGLVGHDDETNYMRRDDIKSALGSYLINYNEL